MGFNIVSETVNPVTPAAPSMLQRTGAMISQGGTNTAAGTLTLITQASDLTPLTPTPLVVTSAAWAASVVTLTLATATTWPVGTTLEITVAGFTPTGYNGTFLGTVATSTTITYPLSVSPGTETVAGTVTPAEVANIYNLVKQFYAQGAGLSFYIYETGVTSIATAITALQTWLIANPSAVYLWLVPSTWDVQAGYLSLVALYTSPTAKTYFITTTTASTYTQYPSTDKSVIAMVNAPTAPATETRSAVSIFWQILSNNPGSGGQVPPLNNRFAYALTPWTGLGIQSTLTAILAANVNVLLTGAEGGLSNTIIRGGRTMDGKQFGYWYAVDWVEINGGRAMAAEVINGSNTSLNPLAYNQLGINQLQSTLVGVMQQAISAGLALGSIVTTQLSQIDFVNNFNNGLYAGQVVVNAVPFASYQTLNPTAYSIGQYGGLSVVFAPQLGFDSILINITPTEIA